MALVRPIIRPVILFTLFLIGNAFSAEDFSPAKPGNPKSSADHSRPPIRKVADGIFEMGGIRMNKAKRTISFPGEVNQTEYMIEYALVGKHGKLHESLLRTDVEPYSIHLAMLLVGAKDTTIQQAQSHAVDFVRGTPVSIRVEWKPENAGADRKNREKVRVEDWIANRQSEATMTPGTWLYTGSRVVGGRFLVQRDQSIVAIIEDIDALVSNPREGRDNDEIWYPEKEKMPPVGTQVTVTFELEKLSPEAEMPKLEVGQSPVVRPVNPGESDISPR